MVLRWLVVPLLVVVPVVELVLLVVIGQHIGLLGVVAWVLLSGLIGAAVAKVQGLGALGRVKRDLLSGQIPAGPLLEAALAVAAGVLLLIPGPLTDVLGALLLVPPLRRRVGRGVRRRVRQGVPLGGLLFGSAERRGRASRHDGGPIIDVEPERREPTRRAPARRDGPGARKELPSS